MEGGHNLSVDRVEGGGLITFGLRQGTVGARPHSSSATAIVAAASERQRDRMSSDRATEDKCALIERGSSWQQGRVGERNLHEILFLALGFVVCVHHLFKPPHLHANAPSHVNARARLSSCNSDGMRLCQAMHTRKIVGGSGTSIDATCS